MASSRVRGRMRSASGARSVGESDAGGSNRSTPRLYPRAAPSGPSRMLKHSQAAEKGPDARRRPRAAREAYSLYVERAVEGANEAGGPFSADCQEMLSG